MFRFLVISTVISLLLQPSLSYILLNPYLANGAGGNEVTFGTRMGNQCYQNAVKSFYPATTTTFYINTAANINFIRCWSGSVLFPINAVLTSGAIGMKMANVQLSTSTAKLIATCEALCA